MKGRHVMTDDSTLPPMGRGITGHGWFVGGPPWPGFQPLYEDEYGRWLLWSDEEWSSWSPDKQQAMFELWDEMRYLEHRSDRPGNAEKLAYCWAMLRTALGL